MVNHYLFLFVLIRVYPRLSVAGSILERAVRLELTIPDLQSGALAAWRRALVAQAVSLR